MSKKFEYNSAAIRRKESIAKDFFNNLNKYINNPKYKPSVIFNSAKIEDIEVRNAFDNYILKEWPKLVLTSPVDKSIKKNMELYLKKFYEEFLNNPTKYLNSPFLKNIEIIDEFCPEFSEKIVNGKRFKVNFREQVKATYYRNNIKNANEFYDKDGNLKNLSQKETEQLMHFFIKNIETNDEKIKGQQVSYIKKLLTEDKKTEELNTKEIEFIAKYMNNYMFSSGLIPLTYNKDEINNSIYIGEDEANKGGFQSENEIYINRKSHLTKTIPRLMQVICHETEHSIQEFEARKSQKSKRGLDLAINHILRNYYSKNHGYDYYHTNYRVDPIERDSEKTGFWYTKVFLNSIGFSDISKKVMIAEKSKEKKRQYEYDYRIDENGKKSTREFFLFDKLSSIISQNKNLISEYPSLDILFEKTTGQPKSFEKLITGDFKFNDEGKNDIVEDFCKYYISKGELDKMDIKKFPIEVQTNIASRLISILGSEGSLLSRMGNEEPKNTWEQISENDKRHIEIFHLKNARNIMNFMNQNYQYFMKLQDNGMFTSLINMDSYNSHIRMFKYKTLYENLIYDNENNISKIQQLALDAEEQKTIYRKNKKKFDGDKLEASLKGFVARTKITDFNNSNRDIRNSMEPVNAKDKPEEQQ